MTLRAAKAKYYANPAWREAKKAANRAGHARRMAIPAYRELDICRKEVYAARRVYENYEQLVREQFRKLERLIKRREGLKVAWMAVKARRTAV